MNLKNPILPGFHPDPSICKVDRTYYIANSTFEWFPGVEISASKDLLHWEYIGSPLDRTSQLEMNGCEPSCGIWAPCLSYCDGLFYLIYTNVRTWNRGPWKDTPNYLVTAPSIEGPWSEPVFLNCSGFDPSLFHDDDGKKYLVNMEWDYRKTGTKQFTGILLQEYDPTLKKLVGNVKKIFAGTDIEWTEGPHLYKRGGYYYLLVAEGGTFYGHAVSSARSKDIDGPYEVNPIHPLITARDLPDSPLQKAGHGSLCDYMEGKSCLVYLCGRPLPGTNRCILGRETALALVEWEDGWPHVIDNQGVANNTPSPCITIESNIEEKDFPRSMQYTFEDESFYKDFKWLRSASVKERFSIKERIGFLRIKGGCSPCSTYGKALLARRQTDFSIEASTVVEFEPDSFQQMAGITYWYNESLHFFIAITYDEVLGKCVTCTSMVAGMFTQHAPVPLAEGPVYLKISSDYGKASFLWSMDGSTWETYMDNVDVSVLSDDFYMDSFTGAFVGMMCVDTQYNEKYADFGYFDYVWHARKI